MAFKATLRIPAKEQYAYVEIEAEGTAEEIKQQYDEMTALMNDTVTDNNDHFCKYLVNLMDSDLTEWGHVEDDYNSFNAKQQQVCQAIKRFYKRLPKE